LFELGHKRVYFVTGKGGTGKTAVCVGLARALARRGRRALLLEIDAPRPNLPSYFGGRSTYEPRVLAPRIDGCNLDFDNAMRSYVESIVPVKRIVKLVLRNKVVRVFLTATPGARELVLLSRVWEYSHDPRWDHLIIDLPASGHALALFRCPFLAKRVFARGPLRARADELIERFSDEEVCSVLFAALPGEMPINETIETRQATEELGLPPIGGFLLNRYPDESFTEPDRELLQQLDREDAPSQVLRAAEAASVTRRDQQVAEEGLRRLEEVFGEGCSLTLPVLPGSHDQVAEAFSLVFGGIVSGASA
jgi:arsenite/tail-anchored protein-transporting ATPase